MNAQHLSVAPLQRQPRDGVDVDVRMVKDDGVGNRAPEEEPNRVDPDYNEIRKTTSSKSSSDPPSDGTQSPSRKQSRQRVRTSSVQDIARSSRQRQRSSSPSVEIATDGPSEKEKKNGKDRRRSPSRKNGAARKQNENSRNAPRTRARSKSRTREGDRRGRDSESRSAARVDKVNKASSSQSDVPLKRRARSRSKTRDSARQRSRSASQKRTRDRSKSRNRRPRRKSHERVEVGDKNILPPKKQPSRKGGASRRSDPPGTYGPRADPNLTFTTKRSSGRSRSRDLSERVGYFSTEVGSPTPRVVPELHRRASSDEIELQNRLHCDAENGMGSTSYHVNCSKPPASKEGKKRVRKRLEQKRANQSRDEGSPRVEDMHEQPKSPIKSCADSFQTKAKRSAGRPSRSSSCPTKTEPPQLQSKASKQGEQPLSLVNPADTGDIFTQDDIESDIESIQEEIDSCREQDKELHVSGRLGENETKAENKASAHAKGLLRSLGTLPKQSKRNSDWTSRHTTQSFASLYDDEASMAGTAYTAKVSVPGIFGHTNHSSSSIATEDVVKTLAPFFGARGHGKSEMIVNSNLKQASNQVPGSLNALLDAKPRDSTVPEPSLCPSTTLQSRTLDSLLDSQRKVSTLAQPSICCASNADSKTLDALLDANPGKWNARKASTSKLSNAPNDGFAARFPLSLDALLDSQPRSFPSSLPEPSVCPPPQDSPKISQTFRPFSVPEDESVSSLKPLQSNKAKGFEPEWDSCRQEVSFGSDQVFSHPMPLSTELAFGAFRDDRAKNAPSGKVERTSSATREKAAELFPLSEHIKIHRAMGSTPSSDLSCDPNYLQLDLTKMGH